MSAQKNKFLMVTPSDSKYLDIIREFIARISGFAGFNDENVNKIQLSVDEACTNVVKHAYHGMQSKDIQIEVEFDRAKMKITVIDTGKGFDLKLTKLKDINNHLIGFNRGGFGSHSINILMDETNYSIQPGKQVKVTMIKFLNQNASREKKKTKNFDGRILCPT